MTDLLQVSHLRTYFETDRGAVKSVDDISFSVKRGEVMGLVGESGSGKSITGFSLIGLLDPNGRIQSGSSVTFEGRELVGLPQTELRKIRGRDIAMVFQDPMMTLNPVISILDQIAMAIRAHEPATDAEVRARAIEALARVQIVDPAQKVDQYPHQFSGGMRQRVAIAIALLHRPKLVIADEPTTALDVSVQAEIIKVVKALVAEMGTSLIWVSHDLATVSQIADSIAVMRHGKILEHGPARQVLSQPQHAYTQGLLDALPSRSSPGQPLASAATEAAGDVDVSSLPSLIGKPADPDFAVADGVSKIFSPKLSWFSRALIKQGWMAPPAPVHAVKSASIRIARGEILGLVGESGSGKSTLGRLICGIYSPTTGEVRLDGAPVRVAERKLNTRVQMIFQDPFASLDPRRTIFQSVAEGPLAHGLCDRSTVKDYVNTWLRAVAFDPEMANRYPHQFSGGQRQRIAIARALAMQPELIVCDEPVASLDVSIQAQVINLLGDLRRKLNITLLFISHDLSVVHHLCDRVLVMRYGEIVEEGSAHQIFHAPAHGYTRMLLDAVPKLQAG